MGNEVREEIDDFDYETKHGMEESENEPLEVTDEENEIRPRSLMRRNQKGQEGKQHCFPRIIIKTARTIKGNTTSQI